MASIAWRTLNWGLIYQLQVSGPRKSSVIGAAFIITETNFKSDTKRSCLQLPSVEAYRTSGLEGNTAHFLMVPWPPKPARRNLQKWKKLVDFDLRTELPSRV